MAFCSDQILFDAGNAESLPNLQNLWSDENVNDQPAAVFIVSGYVPKYAMRIIQLVKKLRFTRISIGTMMANAAHIDVRFFSIASRKVDRIKLELMCMNGLELFLMQTHILQGFFAAIFNTPKAD